MTTYDTRCSRGHQAFAYMFETNLLGFHCGAVSFADGGVMVVAVVVVTAVAVVTAVVEVTAVVGWQRWRRQWRSRWQQQ